MKSLILAKRNIIEYLRSPLVLFFTIVFPVIMFFVFQIIKIGTGATDDIVPMFTANNLTASIAVFSYSFVSLSLSLQISKDREASFQARLSVSPLKSYDFFLGYLFPALTITASQTALCFILGLCFGLSISIRLIYSFFILIFISVFYVCIGLILGSCLSEKACGGVSSIVVNVTALFSGMFFPLTDGTFKTVLSCFPFLPSVAIPQALISASYTNLLTYCLAFLGYMIIAVVVSILIFGKRLKNK